jgi:hypothetical protein
VQEGERVRAGDPLIDGPIDPHDVLAVLGIKELQRYLVDKIHSQQATRDRSLARRFLASCSVDSRVGSARHVKTARA